MGAMKVEPRVEAALAALGWKTWLGCALLCAGIVSGTRAIAQQREQPATIYERLSAAYRTYDLESVTRLYDEAAVTAELDAAGSPLVAKGRAEIRASFEKLFSTHKRRGHGIDIAFRRVSHRPAPGETTDTGIYRFRASQGDRVVGESYGRFVVVYKDLAGGPAISADFSSASSLDEFETAAGPVLGGGSDEILSAPYHDRFLGTYIAANACRYRITRSQRRLYVEDDCGGELLGLDRISGTE